jgi:hypothetical protein
MWLIVGPRKKERGEWADEKERGEWARRKKMVFLFQK